MTEPHDTARYAPNNDYRRGVKVGTLTAGALLDVTALEVRLAAGVMTA
jgi:hypothetical protein